MQNFWKFTVIVLVLLTGLSGSYTYAQEQGVSASPAVVEIETEDGKIANFGIKTKNHEEVDYTVHIYFHDSSYSPEQDSHIQISEKPSIAMAGWIKHLPEAQENQENTSPQDQFLLKAKTEHTAKFELKIPTKTEAQAYYPVIMLEFVPQNTTTPVAAKARIAVPIMIILKGKELREEISIKKFEVDKTFSLTSNFGITTEIENTGNIHLKPRGVIEVYDPNGVRQGDILRINDSFKYLMPHAEMLDTFSWSDTTVENKYFPPMGTYQISLKIYNPGNPSPIAEEQRKILVFPYVYIIYALLLAFGVSLIASVPTFVSLYRIKKSQQP